MGKCDFCIFIVPGLARSRYFCTFVQKRNNKIWELEARAPIIPFLTALTKDTQKQRILISKQDLRYSWKARIGSFSEHFFKVVEKRKKPIAQE